jgi:hypothetical protein
LPELKQNELIGIRGTSMQCPKGGQITEQTHTVKTMTKARAVVAEVAEDDLPVTIQKSSDDRRQDSLQGDK